MLDLNEFAREVHAVSVEHGWWEGEIERRVRRSADSNADNI